VTRSLFSVVVLSIALATNACGSDSSSSGPSGTGGASGSGGSTTGGSGGSGGTSVGGSSGSGTGGSAGQGGSAGSASGGSAGSVSYGPYPSSPYGHQVGDTIADLAWEGFVNETGAQQSDLVPFVEYGTDAMRKSGKSYGLIHVSAFT